MYADFTFLGHLLSKRSNQKNNESDLKELTNDITTTGDIDQTRGNQSNSMPQQKAETLSEEEKVDAALESTCFTHTIYGEQNHKITKQEAKELLSTVWNAVFLQTKHQLANNYFRSKIEVPSDVRNSKGP